MTVSGISTLDHAPQTVAEWLNDIREELGWDSSQRAYVLLRSVLQSVRDWLTVDEAADLAAQLPILVRGIYYDGWNPSATPVHPRSKDDFVSRIERSFDKAPLENSEKAISTVFGVLEKHVGGGEIEQVRNSMRKELRDLWP